MKKSPIILSTIAILFIRLNCDHKIVEASDSAGAMKEVSKDEIRLLIVDGFSNHDWQLTTQFIVKILNEYDDIKTDITTSPDHLVPSETLQKWNPDFSVYDVVLLNCNDLKNPVRWSDRVRSGLENFVARGGGLYIFHSANNAFEDWEAYNKMIGMGWRKKGFGKAILIDDNEQMKVVETGDGEDTSHGKRVDALVTRIGDHPIQKGLPRSWVFADVEIYTYARGPAENLTVLSYAKDEKYQLNFPIEWTVKYGEGNVYNSSLGHQWINQEEPTGLKCAAFQTEMVRAIQWLAGREIDQSVPEDFPGTETTSLRDNIK
ncbi:ThuA domain-containing protein [Fulvivirga sp. M361]|uniref:ThuA domain-containing protein n=1 Tax=Fulvivirga sp. M361 TaxID=2594266 RepID=UPI00117A087B|nr:ThuA domain-containing protein [Fulvivirga sp. M361]TRX59224.1 ThuA domain-containing protein [Fulvivirga sp. M361]